MFIPEPHSRNSIFSKFNILPISVFIITFAVFFLIWLFHSNQRKNDVKLATKITTEQIATRLESWIDIRVNSLQTLIDVTPPFRNGQIITFNNDATKLLREFRGYQAINWINSDWIITSVNPLEGNEGALGKNLHEHPYQDVKDAIAKATNQKTITRTSLIGLLQGGKGFALYLPVIYKNEVAGYINCVFKNNYLIESSLENSDISQQYDYWIRDAGETVYCTNNNTDIFGKSITFTSDFLVIDKSWQISLTPIQKNWGFHLNNTFNFLLLAGLIVASVFFFLIRQNLRSQKELLRKELHYRTLFEETQDIIYYTTQDGRILTHNSAMNRIFGYSDAELSTMKVSQFYSNADDRNAFIEDLKRDGTISNREIDFVHKDGHILKCLITSTLRNDILPDTTVFQGIIRDITELKAEEQKKHNLESIIRAVFETAEDHITIKDKDLKYIHINPVAAKRIGFLPEELIGKRLEDIYPNSDLAKFSSNSDLEALKGKVINEIQTIGDKNNPEYLNTIKVPLYDSNNKPYGVCSISRNITNQKIIEEELRLGEERLELVINNANIGLYDFDIENDHNEINVQWAEMIGYKKDEIEPNYAGWRNLVHPDDIDLVEQKIQDHYDGKTKLYETQFRMKAKDGEWKAILTKGKVVKRDENGIPTRLVGTHFDITQIQKAEEEREKHLKFLINLSKIDEAISGTSSVEDLLDNVLTLSLEIFETDRIWLINPYHPDVEYLNIYREKTTPEFPGAFETGIPVKNSMEYRSFLKAGLESNRPVLFDLDKGFALPNHLVEVFKVKSMLVKSLFPNEVDPWLLGIHHCRSHREWESDEIQLFDEIGYRITDALRTLITLRGLRESEEKFRTIAENTPGIVYMYDVNPDGSRSALYSGPGLAGLVGPETAENVGNDVQKFFSIVPEEDMKKISEMAKKAEGSMLDTTYRVKTDSGHYRWVRSISRSKEINNGGHRVQGMLIDISEQIKAEEALQESQEMLQIFMESATDIITIWDYKLRLIQINKAGIEKLDSLNIQYPVGKSIAVISPIVKTSNFRKYHEVLRTGIPNIIEEEAVDKNGETRYFQNRAFKVGRGIGIISSDVTEKNRIEEERRRIEERYKEAQRMESLSILAGGIAHDFNNLLAGIMGNADLALLDLDAISPAFDSVQQIQKSSERAAELTKQMLAYSGKGKFIIQTFDLSKLVHEMTNLVKSSISKKTRLSFDLSKDLMPIEGDITQIRQLIMNLIINASDALQNEEGIVAVSTSNDYFTSEDLKKTFLGDDLPNGNYVKLDVSDTGCGMDEETLGRIFDPFFTTKFTGRGLGLAAALGIIRGHNGALNVRSKVGQGTTFSIFFPTNKNNKVTEKAEENQVPKDMGSGTILVVDDEEQVRNIAVKMLKRFGFDTLIASDGIEAIATVKQFPDKIDGIIMDLSMPRMGGDQAIDNILEINPKIPIVISSGFSEEDISEKFQGKNIAGFIQKPFRTKDVVEKFIKS